MIDGRFDQNCAGACTASDMPTPQLAVAAIGCTFPVLAFAILFALQ
jgi:hypothetical protein